MRQSRFCAFHQHKRVIAGRPQCIHSARTCPYGMHRCAHCGKAGHGRDDCARLGEPPICSSIDLAPQPPSFPPVPPAPPETSPSSPKRVRKMAPPVARGYEGATPKSTTKSTPEQPAVEPPWRSSVPDQLCKNEAGSSAFIPSKGVGKFMNFGVTIPVPSPVIASARQRKPIPTKIEQLPPHNAQVVSTSAASTDAWVVQPVWVTEEEVQEWYADGYRALKFSRKEPCEVGDDVLWKGFKKGRNGGVSVVPEFFNGVVHHMTCTKAGDIWYDVS